MWLYLIVPLTQYHTGSVDYLLIGVLGNVRRNLGWGWELQVGVALLNSPTYPIPHRVSGLLANMSSAMSAET